MRAAIGAALQEAALDPLLTGREHMRLQTALHGDAARGAGAAAATSCSSASASPTPPTARCGRYSGGMKRRLDLALALVHRPRILFLDEPTTGLDPQSRSALWEEVGRLAKEEGVTVFLTTQYLEEADVLADRVGIIDHGRIVAEGTPAALKAEIGAADGRGRPRRPASSATASPTVLAPLRRARRRPRRRASPCAARGDESASPTSSARSTPRTCTSSTSSCTRRRLDDVFLAKTGRTLEGAERRSRPRLVGRDDGARSVAGRPPRRGARSCARCASRRTSSRR